jgi:predicted FMN-binding regulatory protein PaiB
MMFDLLHLCIDKKLFFNIFIVTMFVPKEYQNQSLTDILQVIYDNPLATFVSKEGEMMDITHLPIIAKLSKNGDGLFIESHLFRQTPLANMIEKGLELTMIIQTGGSYISPAWYEDITASTMNFIAIHCKGKPVVIGEPQLVMAKMRQFVSYFEQKQTTNFDVSKLSDEYILRLLPLITYFQIETMDIKAHFKLSQNKKSSEIDNIVRGLNASTISHTDSYIATWMSKINER